MKPRDTAAILAYVGELDSRQISEQTVQAWHTIIGHVDKDEALEAVSHHFATSTEYFKPAHILQRVEQIHQDRLSAVGGWLHPHALDDTGAQTYVKLCSEIGEAVKSGRISSQDLHRYHDSEIPWREFVAAVDRKAIR